MLQTTYLPSKQVRLIVCLILDLKRKAMLWFGRVMPNACWTPPLWWYTKCPKSDRGLSRAPLPRRPRASRRSERETDLSPSPGRRWHQHLAGLESPWLPLWRKPLSKGKTYTHIFFEIWSSSVLCSAEKHRAWWSITPSNIGLVNETKRVLSPSF